MKRFIACFAFMVLLCAGANAQLLTESFDYPAGDTIGDHGWVTFSGGTTNRLTVTSPGLDFPGYQLPGVGNSVKLRNTGADSYKALSSNVTSGNLYAFFIVNVDTARLVAGGGDYFVGMLPSTSTTNYTCRIYIRNSITIPNTFAFGITKNALSGGAVVWSDSIYSRSTNYLVCAKYTFNTTTTTDDEVSLFVFSSAPPNVEPLPTIGPVTGTTTDVADIGRFALRQGLATTSATLLLDEIWVGTDWSTVLPVELSSFNSAVIGRDVILNWTTSSENNNSGFGVERASSDGNWVNLGFVAGNGNTTSSVSYSFTDRSLNSGVYSYRLKQVDFNGNFEYHNLQNEVLIGVPSDFELAQNYPNPFNPSTVINFDIPRDAAVSLELYDMQGKLVRTLVNEFRTAGYHSVTLNASDLPSGSYLYKLSSEGFSTSKRLMLVK
jgi:hypothetical protein